VVTSTRVVRRNVNQTRERNGVADIAVCWMLQVVEKVRKGWVSEEAEAEERKEKHCAR
jgi:hypothetical protein